MKELMRYGFLNKGRTLNSIYLTYFVALFITPENIRKNLFSDAFGGY